MAQRKKVWLGVLSGLWLLVLGSQAPVVQAAERIFVSFSLFERSIALKDLEVFAKEGRIQGTLGSYTRFFDDQQLEQLRAGLVAPLDVTPLAAAQFLYTSVGEGLLQRAGQVVRPKSGQGNLPALRSALILGAADPEGLTALSALRHFPTDSVQVNLQSALAIFKSAQDVLKETNSTVKALQAKSATAPTKDLIAQGKTLQVNGPYTWQKQTLELNDDSVKRRTYTGRNRNFLADVYVPRSNVDGQKPLIVISHGFNSNRDTFEYLAEHLASHGYAVAVPEHSGSNVAQLQALLGGRAQDIIQSTEFIDRPLDVSYLLDALEVKSQTDPSIGPLNLEQVGIFGQSFGAYTALVSGGGSLSFNQLYQDCAELKNTLNLSLLFQCQARLLIPQPYELADPRIKAVVAVNPIGSSLLGPKAYGEIEVPVMLVSGSSDAVAPALPEQIRPFGWLKTPNKYLMMMVGGNHFSTLGPPKAADQDTIGEILDLPLGGPVPEEARQDLKTISLAFMNAFVTNQAQNREYLTPGYVATLSQSDLPLFLTPELALDEAATEEEE